MSESSTTLTLESFEQELTQAAERIAEELRQSRSGSKHKTPRTSIVKMFKSSLSPQGYTFKVPHALSKFTDMGMSKILNLLRIDVLERQLRAAVRNVVKDIRRPDIGGPTVKVVYFDRKTILKMLSIHISPQGCQIHMSLTDDEEFSKRDGDPEGLGKLSIFPPEVRNTIYKLVISRGHLNILAVSRIVHKEASSLLFRHAIYRLSAVYLDVCPKPSLLNLIQNIQFSMSLQHDLGSERNLTVFRKFGSSEVPRIQCHILFECRILRPPEAISPRIMDTLSLLTGFREVRLELNVYDLGDGGPPCAATTWRLKKLSQLVQTVHNPLKAALEPFLGTAKVAGCHGTDLVFHPGSQIAEGSEKLQIGGL